MDTDVVYYLEDLMNWPHSKEVKLAVIGDPIDLSISPAMHNSTLQEMGDTFAHWRYYKFHITAEELGTALGLFYRKQFMGLNVTIPHKVEVIKYLISVDEIAKVMGAVNTLIFSNKGYRGINTDGPGFEAAVKYHFDLNLKDLDVILLGAGGVSKAIATQCLLSNCKSLWISNRSPEHLRNLLSHLTIMGKDKVRCFDWGQLPEDLPKQGLLVNATNLTTSLPLQFEKISNKLTIFDVNYIKTALIREAKDQGFQCASGLRMLVEQGARSLQAWSRKNVPIETMWGAAQKASTKRLD